MVKARVGRWVGAAWVAVTLFGGSALAGTLPTVQQMLTFRPKQEGVVASTPTPPEEGACKVELISGRGQGSGYLLRDAQGQPLRRFYNTRFTNVNDHTKIDVWSYYKDGVEVYREWATRNGEPPDQFRWMNAGGTRWGTGSIDAGGKGHIDAWKTISPEEVSQEVLLALATHNYDRLQALFITEAEMKALGLPAAEVARLQDLRGKAQAKFQATVAKLSGLGEKTHWLHLETTAPQCLPREQAGTAQDLIKYGNATVLCETDGKNDWVQTGEIVQVGAVWRLADAPTAGLPDPSSGDDTAGIDKEVQPLLDQLRKLDEAQPKAGGDGGPNAEVMRYNLQRADVLEQIVSQVKPEKRDTWIRQVADCLSTASQNSPAGDKTAHGRLQNLEKQLADAMPGSNLAGYVTFREMSAEYAIKLGEKKEEITKVQDAWLERLGKFVQTYPHAEDTADALLQLGMVSEFMNKEIEAKKWYQQLATNYADKPVAAKAQGALKRLDLEGKPLELAGPQLEGGTAFDVARLQGKVVVVYYWASWNQTCVGDFAKLKLLLDSYGPKGLELVTVNLDTKAEDAQDYLKKSPAPGTHLFQPGGLDSPLAVQYGIVGLPNLFLVGKDGKVLSRTVQISGLEEELKKQLK